LKHFAQILNNYPNNEVIFTVIEAIGEELENIKQNTDNLEKTITSSYVATKNYSINDYLFIDSKFYKVISNIGEGDTIIVGTNVIQTTVGEQLTELNSTLGDISNILSTIVEVAP